MSLCMSDEEFQKHYAQTAAFQGKQWEEAARELIEARVRVDEANHELDLLTAQYAAKNWGDGETVRLLRDGVIWQIDRDGDTRHIGSLKFPGDPRKESRKESGD
jgi:hypothetical protein